MVILVQDWNTDNHFKMPDKLSPWLTHTLTYNYRYQRSISDL